MRAGKGVKPRGREVGASLMYPFGAGAALHWPAPQGHIAGAHIIGKGRLEEKKARKK